MISERRRPTAKAIQAIFMISVLDFQFQTVTKKKLKLKLKGVELSVLLDVWMEVERSKIDVGELKKETSALFV
jgi:hypothetical protein